jgi:hypothetical protein
MRLRDRLNGKEYNAKLSTEHTASSDGRPVLVDLGSGLLVDAFTWMVTEVVQASDEERAALEAAGYCLNG